MEIKTVSVTPAMARSYLAQNSHNRRLSPARVMALAAMMRSGSWVLNGETIIISQTGRLLDGQHRLAAIVEYGRPVDMLIASGAPDASFVTIDTGAARSSADILGMKGLVNTAVIAAAAGIIWRLFHAANHTVKVPPAYIVEIVDRYPDLVTWSTRAHRTMRITSSATTLAALVYLYTIANRSDIALALYDGLMTGESLSAGNPILTLRNRMVAMRGKGNVMNSREAWPYFARAISALEAGESLHKFRNIGPSPKFDRPDMFDVHAERLSASEQLLDLLPPSTTNGRGTNLRLLKVAA